MKVNVFSTSGEKKAEIELPKYFEESIREDLIAKAFKVESAEERQPYGAFKLAGRRASAAGKVHHQRRRWKTAYGHGISRVPRKVLVRRGSRFFWQGAYIPGTVKGRQAHPPKAETSFEIKINKKEKLMALKAAIAATASLDAIKNKYKLDGIKLHELPLIVESKIEDISKIKELKKVLLALLKTEKFFPEKSIRAGKGKMRGRKYKKSAGLLLVVSSKATIKTKAFDVKKADELKVKDLAPGGKAGRVVIYSENALEELAQRLKER